MNDVQKIMQDASLTLQAKAIYIYLLHISDGKTRFKMKSPTEIQRELNIGSFAYYAHLHRLEDKGYLHIRQTRNEKNRFDGLECELLGGKDNG